MALYHLLYQSCASEDFTGEELPHLLRQASVINKEIDVTGLLLYRSDGRFVQLLEGAKEPVLALYQRIMDDPRNHSCEVLMQGPWSKRSFPNWCVTLADCDQVPMGLPLVPVKFQELPDFLSRVAPTRPTLVHTLLSFVEPFLSAPAY